MKLCVFFLELKMMIKLSRYILLGNPASTYKRRQKLPLDHYKEISYITLVQCHYSYNDRRHRTTSNK